MQPHKPPQSLKPDQDQKQKHKPFPLKPKQNPTPNTPKIPINHLNHYIVLLHPSTCIETHHIATSQLFLATHSQIPTHNPNQTRERTQKRRNKNPNPFKIIPITSPSYSCREDGTFVAKPSTQTQTTAISTSANYTSPHCNIPLIIILRLVHNILIRGCYSFMYIYEHRALYSWEINLV